MLILGFFLLALLSVLVTGGKLSRLAHVRLRAGWTVLVALGAQVVVISVVPGQLDGLHEPVHLATYVLAGLFVWANRSLPGVWFIGGGGAANLAAIAANGGVMPASPTALASAGMTPDKGDAFANSAAIAEPKLAVLGDIFAVPEAWPLSNVFSLGDVSIVLGVLVSLHVVCGTRLVRRRARAFRGAGELPPRAGLWWPRPSRRDDVSSSSRA